MSPNARCWCGNADLLPFSPFYRKCGFCETLVRTEMPSPEDLRVVDDKTDFYGRKYYESHLMEHYQYPSLQERARTDLSERCLHWLRVLLKYKLPPARILELGSAHGGFVALLRWANFDAVGLELSRWLVNFAQNTFHVPMLLGPLEEQKVQPHSLDVIALMDVMEHLPEPAGTLTHCLNLLKTDGIFLIQTPLLPEGLSFEQMQAEKHPFLLQLKQEEHLYLFSPKSIQEFFLRIGVPYISGEPAIFSHYDMFLIASRSPLQNHSTEEIAQSLILSPEGRMVQALLDLELQLKNMHEKWGEAEADRTARLDRIRELTRLFQESEADRAARLEVIHRFGHKIDELNGQVNELNGQVNVLNEQIGEWEKNFFFRVLRKFHLLSRRERKRFPAQTPEKS